MVPRFHFSPSWRRPDTSGLRLLLGGGARVDVHETIRSRVAVREYKPDPVPDTSIRKVLLAARWAPSQKNRPPWRLVVVQDKDTLRKIGAMAASGGFIAQAPLAIAVLMEPASKTAQFDVARAIENMELAAWEQGLGTTYVGQLDQDKIKALLGVPTEMDLVTVMPFGYPTEKALKAGKRRKPLGEIAHRERPRPAVWVTRPDAWFFLYDGPVAGALRPARLSQLQRTAS